ncbi:unnamed protein product [Leptosia nina]|uniref:Uncharacterized protein n=1 Tax=Leptosia nina TaxID=320188 RepID=A0AAV1IZY6_9NEOP
MRRKKRAHSFSWSDELPRAAAIQEVAIGRGHSCEVCYPKIHRAVQDIDVERSGNLARLVPPRPAVPLCGVAAPTSGASRQRRGRSPKSLFLALGSVSVSAGEGVVRDWRAVHSTGEKGVGGARGERRHWASGWRSAMAAVALGQ